MNIHKQQETPAMQRAELVLFHHRIGSLAFTQNQPARSKAKIDAIIRDIQASNAAEETEE
jgi:hypothetical protein